jgi:hypothetical protein
MMSPNRTRMSNPLLMPKYAVPSHTVVYKYQDGKLVSKHIIDHKGALQ